MSSAFEEWTCAFPGKMGLSWKQSAGVMTKEEAETQAAKNCNVVAIPLELMKHIKNIERRLVKAETIVNECSVLWQNWQYELKKEAERERNNPPDASREEGMAHSVGLGIY
jgi:hypothetical protein